MKINIKYYFFFIFLFHNVNSRISIKNGFSLGKPSRDLSSTDIFNEHYFEQNQDHFNYRNNDVWNQRYYVNEKFYKPGGPVFLMLIGDEASSWISKGAWIEYAKRFNALCFVLESRYFGKSRPKEDLSTQNLGRISVEMNVGDLTSFRIAMVRKFNLNSKTKWIAFGGSFSGTVAAWARIKYPHLIQGAVVSSAPIVAIDDFVEYYDMVGNAIRENSPECLDALENAMQQIELLLGNRSKAKSLNSKFKLCDSIENSLQNHKDLSNFYEILSSNIGYIVQYNKVNNPHAILSINEVCAIMTDKSIEVEIDRLAKLNDKILDDDKVSCFDYKYEKMIKKIKDISWDSGVANGERQCFKLSCSELGFHQTSTKGKSVLSFPISFFREKCEDVFGLNFNSTIGISRTNLFYGGLDIKGTKILHVINGLDPWRTISEPQNENAKLIIKGTGHCADIYEPRKDDSASLVEARNKIESYIEQLLL